MKLNGNQLFVIYFAILILIFSIFLSACKKGNGITPSKGPGKDLVLSAVEQQKATADNSFTLKLFKSLDSANASGVNLFVSPLSVSFALGMTGNGANGETLAAFKNTLGFGDLSQADVNTYYNNLITNLPKLDPNTTLNIANSIWYRQGFNVQSQFLQTNTDFFHAKVSALDFNSASALGTINNWVNTQTNGKITKIVSQISSDDVMFLINAIYFKSTWKEQFNASKTAPLPFHLAGNSQVQASFMDGIIDYNTTYDNDGTSVFELPYSNSRYSMVIVMPATNSSVAQLQEGLDSAKWQGWMSNLHATSTELKIPKFKYGYGIKLNNALTSLGLGIAFSGGADFTGINPGGGLYISAVNHKAYVEVDESGTTAAAVTSVVVTATAELNPPPTVVDHPFIFAIREMSSGLILFVGTVNNPLLTGE